MTPTKQKPVVDDAALQAAFTNTNFGHNKHRELLNASVFKKSLGYHCGHTITVIMQELKLIGVSGKPTKKGIALLREAYSDLLKVSG